MNEFLGNDILPVDIVLAPEWWSKNEKIYFDRDFFYHPLKRVEEEQKMEKILYDRWGQYGLGQRKVAARPEIGAVHLAAGYLLSEMLGCTVNYQENHPPQVLAAHQELLEIDPEKAFRSDAFKQVINLTSALKQKYGYLTGDINWGGVLNIAMDLRGEDIFMDMMLTPDEVNPYFNGIAQVIEKFTSFMQAETGSTSISVNRGVRHMKKPVFLHSECSHTMISFYHTISNGVKNVPSAFITVARIRIGWQPALPKFRTSIILTWVGEVMSKSFDPIYRKHFSIYG